MIRRLLLGILVFAGCSGVPSAARAAEGGIGGLLIAPTRIALEPRDRSAELTLLNRGSAAATYRLTLVEKQMTEDGTLENLSDDTPAPNSARALVRYSPRQVRLAPGQTQKVRFLVRRPNSLAPGEYRSHLLIQTLPEVPTSAPSGDGGRLRIRLTTVTGVSIPVIVRQGKGVALVGMTALALDLGEPRHPRLRLALTRQGNRSAYGDLEVTAVTSDGGDPRVVGRLRGVAVYTPNERRTARVELSLTPEDARAAAFHVTYRRPEDEGGGLLAEGDLTAQ